MTTASRPVGRRRRGRELALRVLFEVEGTQKNADWALQYQGEDLGATPDVSAFAREIVNGCLTHADDVDTAIAAASVNWALVDLGKVERALLRMGSYELLYELETPLAVVIDESVELAKAYAGDEAAQFINGVLGEVARRRP
ncbi:MAG: transcription antitermination factor NusB [Candidatus Dormibacteraeota bacterium]|nr:transcription antitermination factor NusB [Candidatus Dormibacteraeota bacterium]MBV9524316.1 transcription antitermination factor NusB [Candidatus Dormibacteraeota bacterium]